MIEPAQCTIDLIQLAFDDAQRRELQLPLEGLAAELRRVLIGRRQLARFDRVGFFLAEACGERELPGVLLLQTLLHAGEVHSFDHRIG